MVQLNMMLKDNAAYQLFCGREIVKKWHAPDHTKIEEFHSPPFARNTTKIG